MRFQRHPACGITRCRHLVVDTHSTYVGSTRQFSQNIHKLMVSVNRTCVLLASEDMITQRIDTRLAGAKRMTVSVDKHLGDGRSGTPAEKSLPNVQRETSLKLIRGKVQQKPKRVPVEGHLLSLIRRHDRLRGFGLRGRKKLCENRRIRVSGPRRKTLRALQATPTS